MGWFKEQGEKETIKEAERLLRSARDSSLEVGSRDDKLKKAKKLLDSIKPAREFK